MVTYEKSRLFRESAGEALTWDADVPAPPRDRIEFTRLILMAAEDAGLGTPDWSASLPFKGDSDSKVEAFQREIHRYTYRQTHKGPPECLYGEWDKDGTHSLCGRPLTWKEYIECLEGDYFFPWKTSWQFGMHPDASSLVFNLIREFVPNLIEGFSRNSEYADMPGYPGDVSLSVYERISKSLSVSDCKYLCDTLKWKTGVDYPLVAPRWLGVITSEYFALFICPVFGLVAIIACVAGAIFRLYSGWWLLAIIPLILILTVLAFGRLLFSDVDCWVDKRLTFNDLVNRIVAAKRQEWAELQKAYAVNGELPR